VAKRPTFPQPPVKKNAAESLRKWERFLKTASLSNLIPPCFYYLTNLVSGSKSQGQGGKETYNSTQHGSKT
jgi:hypothetical protein